jgi:hypothetical protein
MENIGALSILLAFCFAVYAVVASVTGRLKKNSFLVVSGQRAVYSVWLLLTVGRFPAGLRGRAQHSVHVEDLQVHGLVGRTGRVLCCCGRGCWRRIRAVVVFRTGASSAT